MDTPPKKENPAAPRRCARCGAERTGSALQGLCPECVISAALENLGGVGGESAPDETARNPFDAARESRPQFFGDYQLVGELARGGMGVVYRARQISLNRTVALKMIRGGLLANEAEVRRFRAEVEAVASLDHPHIVPLYEVGECEGHHFFAMKLIEGPTLAEWISRAKPAGTASKEHESRCAQLMSQVARAVHYAHQRGVLHRDLKPGNILLDADDTPYVTDFGLAKRFDSDSHHTLTGAVLGTPSYISPEAASGKAGQLTTKTDVYSLGAVLYQMITGHPPFQAETSLEILRMVGEELPARPSSIIRNVNRDLETICLKCLEKEPGRRYASAEALADDLDRWRAGEPIQARPVGRSERLVSWARRRPAISALASLLLLSLIAAAALLWHANQGLRRAVREQTTARVAETAALHDALIEKARAVRQSGRIGQRFDALAALDQAAKIKLTPEVRNEAAAALANFDLREISRRPLPKYADSGSLIPRLMTLDAELRTGVFAEPGRGLVWHALDGHTAPRVYPGTGKTLATQVHSSPDGRWFLAQLSEELQLWRTDGDACEKRWPIPPADNPVFPSKVAFSFSAGSDLLARAEPDGNVEIFDLRAGTNRTPLPTGSAVIALAFDPAGERLAVVHQDTVEVRGLKTGGRLLAFAMPGGMSFCAWNFDGTEIAAGSQSRRSIEIKFAATGETFLSLGAPGVISRAAFQPGGQLFAAVTDDLNALVWELPDPRPVLALPARDDYFQFSADGRRLVVEGILNDLIVYEMSPSPVFREFTAKAGMRSQRGYRASVSWDGKWVATADTDELRLWEVRSGREVASAPQRSPLWTMVAFAPGDQSLVFSVVGGGVMLRPLLKRQLPDGGATVEMGNFSFAGGSPLDFFYGFTAAGNWINFPLPPKDDMEIWPGGDSAKRRKVAERGEHISYMGAFSPDETLLAMYLSPGQMDIWRTADAKLLQSLDGGPFNNMEFTPDGRWLAVGTATEIQLWETNTWHYARTVASGLNRQDFADLLFSPDGKWMGFQESMERYQLRSFPDLAELVTLEAPHALSRQDIEWSKDSSRIYVLGGGNRLYEWNLAALRAELDKRGLGWNPPKP